MSLNISDILNHLHINDNNEAFSTGSNWGSSAGAQLKAIVSPVDGKKIASVKLATEADYNKVIEKAEEAAPEVTEAAPETFVPESEPSPPPSARYPQVNTAHPAPARSASRRRLCSCRRS